MVQAVTPAPNTPTPNVPKKGSKRRVWIIAISIAVVMIIGGLGVWAVFKVATGVAPFVSVISKSASKNSDYGDRVARYEAENKSFSVGQTMQFGPYDITATATTKDYQPTEEQLSYISTTFRKDSASYKDSLGLNDTTGQYVLVFTKVHYQKERADQPDLTFDEIEPFIGGLSHLALNDRSPLIYWMNDAPQPRYRLSDVAAISLKTGEPQTFTYLYKLPASDTKAVLSGEVTAYTRVSSIVGTEGMPRRAFEYTLQVW